MASAVVKSDKFNLTGLMHSRLVSEYYRGKEKAARRVYKGWIKPTDLPSNAPICAVKVTLKKRSDMTLSSSNSGK